MYSRKPLNPNSRTNTKTQVSHDHFTNRRGTLTIGAEDKQQNNNNNLCKYFSYII